MVSGWRLSLWKREADYVQKKQATDRKRQERKQDQNNVEIVGALNRIADEQHASRDQEHAYEKQKSFRENLTIGGIFAAALMALIQAWLFACSMQDARNFAERQHTDTQNALGLAASANTDARRSADAAERAAKASERAATDQVRPILWLGSEKLKPQFQITTPSMFGRIIWNIPFTNYGKGAAVNVVEHWCVIMNVTRPPAIPGPNCQSGSKIPMPPNSTAYVIAVSSMTITQAQYDLIMSVQDGLVYNVTLTYTDTYGNPYETDICIATMGSDNQRYCDKNQIK